MRFDLVIFDCDGVLVDSEPMSNRVFAETLREAGFPASYEWCTAELIGLSLPSCYAIIEQAFGRPLPDGFETLLQTRTYEAFRAGLRPVAGVREVVEALSVPVCVASSGSHEKMQVSLGVTGLLPLFEGRIFSASEVTRGKPHPDLFLYAAERMHADPARCAVVEDSPFGVTAARAASMAAFGYIGGPHAKDLAASGATVFSDMRDLPALLSADCSA
jgi:HAD superfamily hydrolase (TIGR01509 family)